MKTHYGSWLLAGSITALAAPGCAFNPDGNVEKFRQAIPEAGDVEVPGPENGGGSHTASVDGLQGTADHDHGDEDEWWANGPWAKYYGFTRAVRRDVNTVTAAVLGSVWIIVHTRPSSVEPNEAIWGPHTDALSPVTWRFRVTEVAPREFDYVLEGRPKNEVSDDAYRAVLSGKGYGRRHDKHGDGYFQIDLDVSRELDPFENQDESGTVKITHTLSTHPAHRVTAEVTPSTDDEWWTVTSTKSPDGSGELVLNAFADIDDDGGTLPEDITIASQWQPTGAGRADITLSGGDLPTTIETVTAVECWDSDFYRIYYGDSVEHEATEGDANRCAFDGASF